VVFVNRTLARAHQAAGELGCDWAPLEALRAELERADAVVASVSAPKPMLGPSDVGPALRGRSRPLAIADLSMPRAADPALHALAGVTLWDLSELERTTSENHARRESEVPRVEALIERELRAFTQWARQQSLRPLMNAMRERAEQICRAELERALAEGPLDPERLEAATRRLVERMVAAHADVLQRGADGSTP
jgi:glutamyl-tRNA reductase